MPAPAAWLPTSIEHEIPWLLPGDSLYSIIRLGLKKSAAPAEDQIDHPVNKGDNENPPQSQQPLVALHSKASFVVIVSYIRGRTDKYAITFPRGHMQIPGKTSTNSGLLPAMTQDGGNRKILEKNLKKPVDKWRAG